MMLTCCPNLVFLASLWLKIYIYIFFQTGYFSDIEQFKINIYFANFGQVRSNLMCFLLLTFDRSQLFTELCYKKQSKASLFDKNSETMHTCIGSGTSYFQ